jgi:hypothetical protein
MSNATESSPLSAALLVVSVLACVVTIAAGVVMLLDILRTLLVATHCLLPFCPVVLPQS